MSDTIQKRLPNGEWLYLKGLPKGTTSAQLSAYFHSVGLPITPDCISIKDFQCVACGFVSVQSHVVVELLRGIMEGKKPFDGRFHFSLDVARRSPSPRHIIDAARNT